MIREKDCFTQGSWVIPSAEACSVPVSVGHAEPKLRPSPSPSLAYCVPFNHSVLSVLFLNLEKKVYVVGKKTRPYQAHLPVSVPVVPIPDRGVILANVHPKLGDPRPCDRFPPPSQAFPPLIFVKEMG